MRIAISGFGRIGKTFLRAAIAQNAVGNEFDIVAINTRSGADMHCHLFKYDSVYGRFNGNVEAREDSLIVNDYKIKWIRETDPLKLPWKELEIEWVLESSGEFTTRENAEKHLTAGAKHVLISAPAKDADATIVPGVNDHTFNPNMKVVSLASCTTNCLAPLLKVLEKFGVENGFMSTIHAYTNDQRLIDASHEDWRRARAGAVNIIPAKTGAAKAIGEVLPNMKNKIDGAAYRVPVACGSINEVIALLKNQTTAKEINEEFKRASQNELKGILAYTEEPLVSRDIVGSTFSAVFDAALTKTNGNLVKIAAWYDNEFGYANRLVDFLRKLGRI